MRRFAFWLVRSIIGRTIVGVVVGAALVFVRQALAHAETVEDVSEYIVANVPGSVITTLGWFQQPIAWLFGIGVAFLVLGFLRRNAGT